MDYSVFFLPSLCYVSTLAVVRNAQSCRVLFFFFTTFILWIALHSTHIDCYLVSRYGVTLLSFAFICIHLITLVQTFMRVFLATSGGSLRFHGTLLEKDCCKVCSGQSGDNLHQSPVFQDWSCLESSPNAGATQQICRLPLLTF